ncbi:spore coat protein U domain-containing protein [Sphingomonas sp. CGMCC 1.13654]|uniref:Spore coat protein U domain-containing protein n=1 Tax=Sphingomonas chungangi TaxID=2683589 RepID=A0A838L895_9SPHN|nr:spore coat protein U domain-containing protein [Sphingomonas chungangi]MBA2934769.1 spore coat protein U domain-containing protein [Sphingomonas chungangi]MVW58080.1 fimbrial major subunit CsuA/B family protein [Sphingomonas chungangi]
MPVAYRMAALVLAGAVAGGCGATSATAETSKAFQVSAVVANGCSVTTSGGASNWGSIDLGTVSGVTSGTVQASLLSNGTAGIQIDCTPGMTASVSADTGLNPTSGGVRQLVSGTSKVPYLLYANGSNTAWTTNAIALSFPVGTSHLSMPVVAKATLSGATKAGAYADTVRVTLSW